MRLMKIFLGRLILIAPLFIMLPVQVCHSYVLGERRSTAALADDTDIELRASSLLSERFGYNNDILTNVISFNRTALITGFAPDAATKLQIGELVAKIERVRQVVNEVQLTRTPSSSSIQDGFLTFRVSNRLPGRLNAIKVHVVSSTVYLMGLATEEEAQEASGIVARVPGVRRVVRAFEIISESKLASISSSSPVQEEKPPVNGIEQISNTSTETPSNKGSEAIYREENEELKKRLEEERKGKEQALVEVQAQANAEIARIKAEAEALKAQAPQATQNPNYAAINSAHALVIGNSSYAGSASLANPVNDAKAISKKLRSLGFKVTEVIDASRAQMVRSLSKFSETSEKADVTLLFYAGHGVQISGINYMIPVDTNLSDISEATLQAISLNSVVERYLPGKTKLVFLDACRDNPLMTASSRGVTRGLAPINVSEGTLISYATKDGQTAADGTGRKNSPYTAALLEHLADPQDIAVVLRKVRAKVMKSTKGKQQPWEYGSLTGGELILSAIKQGVRATPSTSVASSEQPSSGSSSALQGSSDVVTPSTTQEQKISQHIRINSSKAPKSFSDGAAMIIRFNTQGWVWVRESSDMVREFLTKAGDIVRFDELPLFIVLPFPDQVEVTIANSPVTLLRNDDEKNAARYSKFMLKQLVSRR